VVGPDIAYALTAVPARWLYRLLPAVRLRSEAQCRAALAGRLAPSDVPRLAERAFIHRMWDLVDLMLADRLLHRGTFRRYGGVVPPDRLRDLLDAQRRGRPTILLTSYYGPFDLLPVFLGFQGVRATAVYLAHGNPEFEAYRRRIRARGGWEFVPLGRAAGRTAAVLGMGGTIALVADHYADRRGLPTTFLGLPNRAQRSVGLLACHYRADVIVAGLRRCDRPFRFEIVVADVIRHADWADEADPVAYVTDRYLRGLEAIILADPSQYLWIHARWGEDTARALAEQWRKEAMDLNRRNGN